MFKIKPTTKINLNIENWSRLNCFRFFRLIYPKSNNFIQILKLKLKTSVIKNNIIYLELVNNYKIKIISKVLYSWI